MEIDIPAWAEHFGVVCLGAEFSWQNLARRIELPGWEPYENFREGLVPAKIWTSETDAVFEMARNKIQGFDQGFHVVHARTEEDFWSMCVEHVFGELNVYCYVSDAQITAALVGDLGVKSGDLIFISSGAKLEELPVLCSTYRCFDLPMVWDGFWDRSYLEQAQMRYMFALRGIDLYGNKGSTFFYEMQPVFDRLGKHSAHYNAPCNPQERNCSVQAEEPYFNSKKADNSGSNSGSNSDSSSDSSSSWNSNPNSGSNSGSSSNNRRLLQTVALEY